MICLVLSGFYPKFVKKYAKFNRIIEKAVKKYTRDVKLKKFPKKKFFKWNKKLENKIDLKEKLIKFL